jgi:K+-transporting ATPase KdpF subunit
MTIEGSIAAIVAASVLAYLVYSLVRPEHF